MTSIWRELPGHDAPDPEGDESDLSSYDAARADAAGTLHDPANPQATRDFIDRGMSDAQDLHRLEESIRWLVDAGTGSGHTAPLPRIVGLADDDTLLLNPDTLFAKPRGRSMLGSAARVLMVSAIAAPTAYFIANWLQTPGAATSADPVIVATAPAVVPDDRADAGPPVTADTSAVAPINTIARADETATPSDSTVAAPEAVTPEPTAPPPVPASPMTAPPRTAAPAAIPPAQTTAIAVPAKPHMPPEDAAKFVIKGNELLESGDVIAARLFFRRAADAGDPAAAMAMGTTYDPEILAKRGILHSGDAEEAERWYALGREMSRGSTALALGH